MIPDFSFSNAKIATTRRPSDRAVTRKTQRTMRSHSISLLHPLLAISNLFIAWKCCCVIAGTDIPIVVVISESMAPAFHRGDLLLLWNRTHAVKMGEVPLVWFSEQPLPMVHRAVQSHWDCSAISGGHPVYVAARPSPDDILSDRIP
jgi:hypothetical protein